MLLTLDFETYYDQDYSLRKMTTQEYILDQRFEIQGLSIIEDYGWPKFISGRDMGLMTMILRGLIKRHPMWVCHNGFFDFGILSWIFDLHPTYMADTRMMANVVDKPFVRSVALETLAKRHSLPDKETAVLASVKGVRLADMPDSQLDALGVYCRGDTYNCNQLFKIYKPYFPTEEIMAIHRVLEMATKPQLIVDPDPLDEAIDEDVRHQDHVLSQIGGFTKEHLTSNPKFAAALTMLGVTPPMKLSPTTGKSTYAFAKKDLGFLALREHEDPNIRALVEARLVVKSNIIKTRAERLKRIAALRDGYLSAPMVYNAAHTGRLGGTDGLNLQNLTRGSKLREALKAPDGYKVIAGDLSQIEARLTAWFCGEESILHAYRTKQDLYCKLATNIFGYEVNKEDHPAERFVGKTGELSLQYGSGHHTFELMLRTSGQVLPAKPSTYALAANAVEVYRKTHPKTCETWEMLDNLLKNTMSRRGRPVVKYKGLVFGYQYVLLPNGLKLQYPELRWREVERITDSGVTHRRELTYVYGGAVKKIYGAKLLENIIQALARIVIRDHWLHIAKTYKIALQVHDELVMVVPDALVDAVVEFVTATMRVPPGWAPDLPVDCEVNVGQNYLEAK